ncbi:IclR family transcriptional regulator [Flavivirga sp. 57AJ16]|uniref:IclR family transcriptional regulator n=1 Tax=Flavivirga sp. 57AJ16 TaxID=3025307 RepID=UPI002367336A|nr:IclR family transcriptional regulator [Flavivirga sp. 57AJ16]MDD7886676.1 IclR family transcriptional regulator [Flavivirga sp. 57AJ16]
MNNKNYFTIRYKGRVNKYATMKEVDKNLNLSVIKAFKLLDVYMNNKQEWGVRELAKKTGYNKTTTYRLLSTLESLDIVQKNDDDKYILGLKLFELGNLVSVHKSLRNYSRAPLETIAKDIKETVHFGVLSNHRVLYLNKAESELGLKVSTQIGSYQQAYCTALGKVLLAFSPTDQILDYLKNVKLDAHTTNTIIDSKALLGHLEHIRKEGYALDMEELEIGLICIAIPVFNKNKEVVAGISVSGPSSRFKPENVQSYLSIIKKGALEIENHIRDYN